MKYPFCAPDTDNIHRYVLFIDDVLWRFGERERNNSPNLSRSCIYGGR
jgi:hypothetical protein